MTTLKGWVHPAGSTRHELNLQVDIHPDGTTTTIDLPGYGRIHIRWLTADDGEGTLSWSLAQQVFTVRAKRDATRRRTTGLHFFHQHTDVACGTCTLEEHSSL
jgi:hypothetical protein